MRIHFIQHVAYESPGYLLQWASEQQHTVSFTRMYESPAFPSPDNLDLLIVMGGPMGTYDEGKFAWLKPEKEFIRSVIAAGKKVLGICLGSQLVAEVLGAKVYPHTQKEIGWWPVKKTGAGNSSPLLQALPDQFISFHWHGDTFDLPPNALHLLSTDACPHQGYVYDNRVMGLQFHMEAIPTLIASMTEHGKEELKEGAWIQSEKEIMGTREYFAENNRWMGDLVRVFSET